jgi:hypothetical protein
LAFRELFFSAPVQQLCTKNAKFSLWKFLYKNHFLSRSIRTVFLSCELANHSILQIKKARWITRRLLCVDNQNWQEQGLSDVLGRPVGPTGQTGWCGKSDSKFIDNLKDLIDSLLGKTFPPYIYEGTQMIEDIPIIKIQNTLLLLSPNPNSLFQTVISCFLLSRWHLEADLAALPTLDQPMMLLPRRDPSQEVVFWYRWWRSHTGLIGLSYRSDR